jgi:hypothetical protein
MQCPRKLKCKTGLTFYNKDGKQFICSGKPLKPKKCKQDIVKLCIKGTFSKLDIEMKPSEALLVASCLLARLSEEVGP